MGELSLRFGKSDQASGRIVHIQFLYGGALVLPCRKETDGGIPKPKPVTMNDESGR